MVITNSDVVKSKTKNTIILVICKGVFDSCAAIIGTTRFEMSG